MYGKNQPTRKAHNYNLIVLILAYTLDLSPNNGWRDAYSPYWYASGEQVECQRGEPKPKEQQQHVNRYNQDYRELLKLNQHN